MEAREIVWEEAHAAAWQRADWRLGCRLYEAYGELARGQKQRRPWELHLSRALFFSGDRVRSLDYALRALARKDGMTREERAGARAGTFITALERGDQDQALEELNELETHDAKLAAAFRGNWWRAEGDFVRARECHAQALQDFSAESRWHHIFAMDLEISDRITHPADVRLCAMSSYSTVTRMRLHYDLLASMCASPTRLRPLIRPHALMSRDDGYTCLDQLRESLFIANTHERTRALVQLRDEHFATQEHFRLSWRLCAKDWLLPPAPAHDAQAHSAATIRISEDGTEIEINRRTISLHGKPTLQRAILALKKPCSESELVSQMWPEERLLPRSAKNRVHVALHTLRKLGLRDHLVFREGRYRIVRVSA